MIRIGLLTIGQSPRVDILTDWKFPTEQIQLYKPMDPLFPPKNSIIPSNILFYHVGALDFLPNEKLKDIEPDPGEPAMVSRLKDGSWQKISHEKLKPYMQECVTKLEKLGCESIVLLCTGDFKYINYKGLLIKPGELCKGIINSLLDKGKVLGIFSPLPPPKQKGHEESEHISEYENYKVIKVYSNPYDLPEEKIKSTANEMKKYDIDLIYMNCLGYSLKHKKIVFQILNKPIILPRIVIAEVLYELYHEI